MITLGTVYLIVTYTNLLRRPIRELTQQVENLQNIGAATERLTELRAIRAKIIDGPGAEIPAGALGLAFDNVHFAYKDGETVLEEIDFELKPGTVLGLLGRTGSGKTTLARLIFRLYDPTHGHDHAGRRAADPTPAETAARAGGARHPGCAALPGQRARQHHLFRPRASPTSRILEVIDELGSGRLAARRCPRVWIPSSRPAGAASPPGEAQLLAFTRIFLRNPGLVILDEASSRLDPATEQLIERAIDKLLQDRTAIIIAHRLGTVHRTDEIMILEDGRRDRTRQPRTAGRRPGHPFSTSLLSTGLEEVLA